MALIKGTNVGSPVVPFDTADVNPSHEALYGRGGYRTVAATADRDAIPAARREAGMLVYVVADGKIYTLAANLTSWSELQLGGVSSWNDLTGKPTTFPPSAHTHDDRYYTETEIDTLLAGKQAAGSYAATVHSHTIAEVTGLQTALNSKATPADISTAVASLVNSAPAALDTLAELSAALGNDASFATTVTNALAAKAPLASPTFTGTVGGITAAMVGLGNVPNVDARARSSHTGTQLAATISDFASAVAAASPEEVIEATTVAGFPATGDTSSLYIATDTSRFYRFDSVSGKYVEVGPVATYPATHTHTASQITGGTATTFLRGDGTFAAVGPALVLSVHTQTVAIAGNANTNLIYSTVTTDTDSAYSTTTGKYTVPAGKGGIYAVYMGFVADGATEGDTLADLKIFGTTLGEVSINGSSTYAAVDTTLRFAGMVLVSLTAGEEINLRSYATKALTANNASSTFNVFKLFRM